MGAFCKSDRERIFSWRTVSLIREFMEKEDITIGEKSAEVWLGRDTRPSGESLLRAAEIVVGSILGSVAIDIGILTTPQLHWMVRAKNKSLKATENYYFDNMSASFRFLIDLIPMSGNNELEMSKLLVDGANGVGGQKIEELRGSLTNLDLEIRNTGRDGGVLNESVGADLCRKKRFCL
ncbi:Phosphoacetylglucosamine mutase [Cardamine amara subsp. amara]|uniref:Phosphoacetylglucosamine mutase n=1 Tax=Cardamine amara subsp. amara TaxID=228776 RepID=A0ABD1ASD0_CARAN